MSMTSAGLEVASSAEAAGGPPPASRWRGWAWPAGFAAGALVLCLAYLRQAQRVPVMSDGASNALQAWDMLHGNLLLRGWTLTDLSFYTTELPEYMMTEALRGLGPAAAHLAAAITYTLVVLGAALLAKGRATDREALVRVVLAAGIMLAPPLGVTSATLLNDPDHVGTQVPLLLVWLILDRARPRWYVPAAVAVVLAWAQVADPLVSYEGVLPVVVVCVIRLCRRRSEFAAAWRDGALPGQLARHWLELALAAGAVVSVGAAALALHLISTAGGFTLVPLDTTFSQVRAFFSHVGLTMESVLVIFGADFSGKHLGAESFIELFHLAGVALAAWGLVRALRRFTSADLVIQVLVTAMIVQLAAYTFWGSPDIVSGPHEIAGTLPVGAVLAGRMLAQPLARARHAGLAAILLACNAGILAHDAVQPLPPDNGMRLAAWLKAHHLTYGLATYWFASNVTVDSGGVVVVRPVNLSSGGNDAHVAAVSRDTNPSWYDARRHDATFLIMPPAKFGCVAGSHWRWLHTVTTDFGPPAAIDKGAGFLIYIWHENLLRNLKPPASTQC